MRFENIEFLKSVTSVHDLPLLQGPEIAVIGRSNVGKSTLINHLFKKKKLAKVSSEPGKTRALNFFIMDKKAAFVDLPGYGYAKVSKSEKSGWPALIETYLNERKNLSLMLFLLDIRHSPSKEDLCMFKWIESKGLATILVFTKCDKVSQGERELRTREILRIKDLPYVHYSATKNVGRHQLISQILKQLEMSCS